MTPSPAPPERADEIERAERLVRERNAAQGVPGGSAPPTS